MQNVQILQKLHLKNVKHIHYHVHQMVQHVYHLVYVHIIQHQKVVNKVQMVYVDG